MASLAIIAAFALIPNLHSTKKEAAPKDGLPCFRFA